MDPVVMEKDGSIARLTLNRPDQFNAFDMEVATALAKAAASLAADDAITALVVTGNGKAFCAGGNLKWVLSHPAGPEAAFHELAGEFHRAVVEFRRMPKPVIAAINGVAAGAGFTMALACDFRVMAKSATLRQAYTSVGLSIDGGGTHTLPRLVGTARAMEIAAFDMPIDAEKALEWGLVNKVVEDGKALDEAFAMAGELNQRSLASFAKSKRLIYGSFDTPFETQLEMEREGIQTLGATPEGMERMRAFAEKRKPDLKKVRK